MFQSCTGISGQHVCLTLLLRPSRSLPCGTSEMARWNSMKLALLSACTAQEWEGGNAHLSAIVQRGKGFTLQAQKAKTHSVSVLRSFCWG